METKTMTDAEQQEWDLKLRKLDAEIAELTARTQKQLRENIYYPAVVGSGVTLAIIAVASSFLSSDSLRPLLGPLFLVYVLAVPRPWGIIPCRSFTSDCVKHHY